MNKLKFYPFRQNNSGGSFYENKNLDHNVYVQAYSAEQANKIAQEELGIYFDGCSNGIDCECCGDRWYRTNEYKAIETSEDLKGEVIGNIKYLYKTDIAAILHTLDGYRHVVYKNCHITSQPRDKGLPKYDNLITIDNLVVMLPE